MLDFLLQLRYASSGSEGSRCFVLVLSTGWDWGIVRPLFLIHISNLVHREGALLEDHSDLLCSNDD